MGWIIFLTFEAGFALCAMINAVEKGHCVWAVIWSLIFAFCGCGAIILAKRLSPPDGGN